MTPTDRLAATPAPLDGRRTAAAATFAEALHRDVPWFVGGSQDAENAMLDAIEAEARATPAPLDVLVAEEAVYAALLYINQRTPRPRAARALMDALRQDGYEVRRVTLAATPAPLDGLPGLIAIHRAWHENPRYDIALDTPCPLAPLDGLRAALEIIAAEPTAAPDAIGVTARNVARHALAATPAEADEDGEYPLVAN